MLKEAESPYRTIRVAAQPSGFGAEIVGLDLTRPRSKEQLAEVKAAWARHGVVAFPDQPLNLDQLEAFALAMGPFGDDPFVKPMPGHPNVLELRREPDEKAVNFGAGWHSDWSFQPHPPAGGDTLYCDCSAAYEALTPAFQALLAPLKAIHSAARPYGTQGSFAKETAKRTMQIISSKEAEKTHLHPLVRPHPVTGRKALFVSPVYTVGIEGMTEAE